LGPEDRMICRTCQHCDAKTYAVPICVKAASPQACVLVLRRVADPCPHWVKL